jgi:hypothetical protein
MFTPVLFSIKPYLLFGRESGFLLKDLKLFTMQIKPGQRLQSAMLGFIDYPFTAPAATPLIKYFLPTTLRRIKTGTAIRNAPVIGVA